MSDRYDRLKLENQLCFPLYACSKEIVRKYKPHLEKLDLTYTQYLAMMVLWEHDSISVKEVGEYLYLDSGTLTPVLKALEKKGYVNRSRSAEDERVLIVSITEDGRNLRDQALKIPPMMCGCINLPAEEMEQLQSILKKLLKNVSF